MLRKISTGLVALMLVVSMAASPVAAAAFTESSPTAEIVEYGSPSQPSFIVSLESGSMSSLRDWANASSERAIISTDANGTVATVAAPYGQILDVGLVAAVTGPGTVREALSGDPLSARSYVKDIAPNYRLSYAEPVSQLQNASAYQKPTEGVAAFDDPELPTSGMAFNGDAPETNMSETKKIVGLDNVSATGQNVTVAVIDTGLNRDNGATYGNQTLNASASFLGNGTTTVNESGWSAIDDENGHGTWTASAVHQMAPNASLLVLQALNKEGSGSTADIARAIRYAADHNATIISMSLGSPLYSEALADAIDYATDRNTTVVAAVGNSRQTWRYVATPADVEGVIGVAATNGTAAANAGSAYFSNIGPAPGTTDSSNGKTQGALPTIAAPGMSMTTPTPDGNMTLSGTSMSTPIVAGGLAAVLAEHPDWKDEPQTVRKWITKSARPVPSAAKAEVGHGMFAADHMNETWNPKDQAVAMDTAAEQRGTFYRSLSTGSGRWLPLQRLSEVVGA